MCWILVVIEIIFALLCLISIKYVGLILIIILYLFHLEYFFVNLELKYYHLEIIILYFGCYFFNFVVQFQLNV
jgi:hypothetical protein